MRLHYKNLASRPTATTGRNIKTGQQYKPLLQNAVKQSVKHKETSKNNWWDNSKNLLSAAGIVGKVLIYGAAQPILSAVSFVAGALSALADDLGFTAGQRSASGSLPAYSAPFGKQNAFASGRILGHGAALVAGFVGVAGGGALAGTGVAATTTGVLAPAGAVAVAGGAVIAVAGAAVVTSATANIAAGDPNIQFSTVQGGSHSYKAPEGGGGTTAEITVDDTKITFGHGGRHLEGTGLSPDEVNQAIAKDLIDKKPGVGQFYKGQISVNGVTIEYTSYRIETGLINIGTYYPVP